jgi:multidrug resistance efflux pump
MKKYQRVLLTAIIVLVAVATLLFKYWDYARNPWTRDGQVRANVIQIAPRVSGPIVNLTIGNNQFVKTGDLLFEIDPRTFAASLEQARAQLDETDNSYQALFEEVESAKASVVVARHSITQAEATIKAKDAEIEKDKAELERQKVLLPQKATSQKSVQRAKATYEVSIEERKAAVASAGQSQASLAQAQANLAKARANLGAAGNANPQIRSSKAAVRQAELNLEFTRVLAPADGYITNLNLMLGSQAVANQPALALVDVNSYWVQGFFKETAVANIRPGNQAVVTLMTYPDTPLEGRVTSLGWGIAQQDGSTGSDLLPNVSPTFEWIRLAQRVPVLIQLDNVPDDIALRVGTTASVQVLTGTVDPSGGGEDPPEHGALP